MLWWLQRGSAVASSTAARRRPGNQQPNSQVEHAEYLPMDEIRDLTSRLRVLETKNRRLSRLTCLLALSLAATLVVGQATAQKPAATQQDEVRAKRFVLVDDDGDCRASLGFAPGVMAHGRSEPGYESAILNLGAKSNKTGITLMVMHDGRPGLMVIGKDGTPRITARLLPDENPCLWFLDNENKDRLKMSLDAAGTPSIVLKDKDGKETVLAP